MKVLVAYEYRCRFYREVIARAIANHRPHLTHVPHVGLEELNTELVVFDPHVLISSQPTTTSTTSSTTNHRGCSKQGGGVGGVGSGAILFWGTHLPRWEPRESPQPYPR